MSPHFNPDYVDQLPYSAYRRRVFGKLLPQAQDRILMLLQQPAEQLHDLANKLQNCCTSPQIISLNEGERYYLTESRCRSRLCPRCSKIRAAMLGQRIAGIVHHMDSPRFLTLTIRSTPGSLRNQLRHLRKRFAAMRRTFEWLAHVRGGVYTLEITYNQSTSQWHPHLHAIIDGSYFPHPDLLKLWSQICDDESGVDIRKVVGIRKIANYLAAYVSKSCDLSNLPPDQLCEWAIETQSLRLAQTFGSYHANKPASDKVMVCSYTKLPVNVNALAAKAELGDERCESVLRALSGSSPCDRPDFMFMVARAIPPPPGITLECQLRAINPQIPLQFA